MSDPVPGDATPPGDDPAAGRPAALAVMGVILAVCLISSFAIAGLSYVVFQNAKEKHDRQ